MDCIRLSVFMPVSVWVPTTVAVVVWLPLSVFVAVGEELAESPLFGIVSEVVNVRLTLSEPESDSELDPVDVGCVRLALSEPESDSELDPVDVVVAETDGVVDADALAEADTDLEAVMLGDHEVDGVIVRVCDGVSCERVPDNTTVAVVIPDNVSARETVALTLSLL